jgi:hypothetical protein
VDHKTYQIIYNKDFSGVLCVTSYGAAIVLASVHCRSIICRTRISNWEPFYKTAVSVRELLALRADVKRAVKER